MVIVVADDGTRYRAETLGPCQGLDFSNRVAFVNRGGFQQIDRFSSVELGDGTHHKIGKGDLVFIEDQGGKGHRSHMLTPIANLFLIVPDDFDLLAWAGQPMG